MLDNDLRRLERRSAETASPQDEALLLRARVRSGQLDPSRLELAAQTGHVAANLAVGRERPATKTWRDLRGWAERLSSFGWETNARAGLADAEQWMSVVRFAFTKLSAAGAPHTLEEHSRVLTIRLDALRVWLADPNPSTRAGVARVMRSKLDPPAADTESIALAGLDDLHVALSVSQALLISNVLGLRATREKDVVFGDWWPYELEVPPERLIARIRGAVRRAIAPWALGERDPVAERLRDPLERMEIASPCSMTWESLIPVPGDPRVRRCEGCKTNVYDLSELGRVEALRLLRDHEGTPLCARLFVREDGRVLTRDCLSTRGRASGDRPGDRPASLLGGVNWWA
jgi:hypothetical protein